ncbi:MAG: radical SAM protein, partial [Endomicrobiia bacterium]
QSLHVLIQQISKIPGLYWIRVLYTNPKHFYPELIKTISDTPQVCKYVDLPIQHTEENILNLMNRGTRKQIFDTIEKLRKNVPNITLRTTVIVGFPTETEKQFKTLLTDIENLKFDWLGCFEYSKQAGTKAINFKNHIPKKIKSLRYNQVMQTQQKITFEKNKSHIGKVYPVLLDSQNFGHTEFQSPEIDGKVILKNSANSIGEIIDSKIISILKIYDLVGEMK